MVEGKEDNSRSYKGRRQKEVDKEEEGKDDLISEYSKTFRSKLIQHFNLLDHIQLGGSLGTLAQKHKFESGDLLVEDKLWLRARENATSLISFQATRYSNVKKEESRDARKPADRRKNRISVKYASKVPLPVFSNWIVQSKPFQRLVLLLIIINFMCVGIQAEIMYKDYDTLKTVLSVIDNVTLFVFILEILLKLVDNPKSYWLNKWNIFDFIVTIISIIPEVTGYASAVMNKGSRGNQGVAETINSLKTIKSIRCLKLVTRFPQVRIIVLSTTKAIKALVFISILLLSFTYVFAIAGIMIFEPYTNSPHHGLEYQRSFENLGEAFVTLFRLFTLDHWLDFLKETFEVIPPYAPTLYTLTWIIIASFIFNNIFVSIMVNNFQNIRQELYTNMGEFREAAEMADKDHKFREEMHQQDDMFTLSHGREEDEVREVGGGAGPRKSLWMSVMKRALSKGGEPSLTSVSRQGSVVIDKSVSGGSGSQHLPGTVEATGNWQKVVKNNLELVAAQPEQTLWPKDTFFTYLQLMENLEENIHERHELIGTAMQAILNMLEEVDR